MRTPVLIEFNAVNQIETHLLCQHRTEHEWLEKYHWRTLRWARDEKTGCLNTRLGHHRKAHGKTAAQVALRFLMQSVVVVIPKSVHEGRIKENFDAFDFELTADEMAQLVKMDTAIPLIGNAEDPAVVEMAMKW